MQTECADCGGTGYRRIPNPNNPGYQCAIPCRHTVTAKIEHELARIAPRDRWARLDTLEICDDPTKCFAPPDLQGQIIDALRAEPDGSFAFFGPSGFGKTTYLAALWHHAVTKSKGCGCYYRLVADLVRDLRDLEFDRGDGPPYLSRAAIRAAVENGLRPRVFLDEFDKVNPTPFVQNAIHELLDEIYGMARGNSAAVQLVIATNLDRDEFMNAWGSNVLRRVEAVCGAVFDFFPELAMVER